MPDNDGITSDELDGLLDGAATLHAARSADGTEVQLCVAVDPDTLQELEQRAAAGTDLNIAAVNAIREGAHSGCTTIDAALDEPSSRASCDALALCELAKRLHLRLSQHLNLDPPIG